MLFFVVACFFFVPHFVSLWSWIVEWMNDVLNCSSVTNFVTLTMKMEDHLESSSNSTAMPFYPQVKTQKQGYWEESKAAQKKNERKTRSWYIRLSDLMHDGSFLRHFKLQPLFSLFCLYFSLVFYTTKDLSAFSCFYSSSLLLLFVQVNFS